MSDATEHNALKYKNHSEIHEKKRRKLQNATAAAVKADPEAETQENSKNGSTIQSGINMLEGEPPIVKAEKKVDCKEFASSISNASRETQKIKRPLSSKLSSVVKSEENFEPINRWWEQTEEKKTNQWEYLEHNGLSFVPPYQPHKVPVIYQAQKIVLRSDAEEIANFWCAALDSDYGKKELFIKNFWDALTSKLSNDHQLKKARFEDVDFSLIKQHLDENKEVARQARKALTKEQREVEKLKKEAEEGCYAYALFDWLREKVGTFKTEIPTLFRGRGIHPKMGVLKRRIIPDEVVLNLHEEAPVPRLPDSLCGHSWKDIVHDNSVSWLACYRDTVNDQVKYTFLSPASAVKGQKDYMKYEKARRLKNYIDKIRSDYTTKMQSDDLVEKQLGTATYMLDVLALRVGNEKDCAEEADTVGCCSLRVEHVEFKDSSTIVLDFLGKDSIRYLNTVQVNASVMKNLKAFVKNKKQDGLIFDQISTGALNKYLREQMQGLSAKVFRTYNASVTLHQELSKFDKVCDDEFDASNPESIKHFYEAANREVAVLCNHQRSVPKQHENSMEKLRQQYAKFLIDIQELQAYLQYLKSKSNEKAPFKFISPSASKDEDEHPRVSAVKANMKKEAAEKTIQSLKSRLASMELRIKIKDDNKTISSTTSKQHYMDPRITVAFCKKWELPIEKLFNTTLRKKFPWAMYARSDFCF